MDNIISVQNVSYDYVSGNTTNRGVSEINLDIERGSFVVFIGHNGSGKSTLAKLLNGFFVPDQGKVLVNDIDTADEEKTFEIRSKVGMVFQNPDNQMVASIIEDDLAFGPENLGVKREEIKERIDWALKTVNMEEYRNRTPNRLSGGQKQRIAIAAILVMKPEVLILDESTAMLDPKGRDEVMDTVLKLNSEEGMTVILITHYMEEAIRADKVAVMNEGRIVLAGKPKEVFEKVDIIRDAKLELPVATKVSVELRKLGYDIPLALTEEELVESLVLGN
ncbi:MAG: Energy-coupling factor transporter ATP-binding protein EcfA1 [Firmicutes bacterium ADurb.Bin080]|nr:energy-coupling factor transporter ATPase [Clostridiales bacterium]OQC14769.1 MAG: Energy-coupling factor transporter ATP-binding protein EcfA1 [Firmicutes bacterium ADurb.Bin080]